MQLQMVICNAEMQDPARAEKKDSTPEDRPQEYTLSAVENAALGKALAIIAQLAPTLKEAELRVLIALARLFAANDPPTGRISSRQLAERVRITRPNVQKAIDSLGQRGLIATREGTATTPGAYALTFLRIKPMGGSFRMPPPEEIPPLFHNMVASEKSQGGSFKEPPAQNPVEKVALLESQGGSFRMPPPARQGEGDAGARVDSIDSISIIDRLLKAKAKNFDPSEISEAKRWVHGYQLKFGRDKEAHPPDDTIMAQIITAAGSLGRLIGLVQELRADRKEPGGQYSWYATVALQRIHGIRPELVRQRRAELRVVREPSPPAITGEQQPLIETGQQILDDVMKQRRAKGAR